MISTIEPGRTYFVEVNKPHLIDKDLNEAVDLALEYAMKEGRYGILVTRHGHSPLPWLSVQRCRSGRQERRTVLLHEPRPDR